jgi:dihydropteroate synthase
MGILNVTPDSFSDGGRWMDPATAASQAERLVAEGADVIDLGAESTRPGSEPVGAGEELARLVPAIREVRRRLPGIPISADTRKREVAAAAVAAGADILNDVQGAAEPDARWPSLAPVAAELGCPWILMHNRARPHGTDLWGEVLAEVGAAVARATAAGVPRRQLWLDPGFGFGKTPAENLELVGRLERLTALGLPVLMGTSRKSTLGKVLGEPDPARRLPGDAACAAWGISRGAAMIRVHDVAGLAPVARMADALRRGRAWKAG